MAGETTAAPPPGQQKGPGARVVSDQDKALSADWLKRIAAARTQRASDDKQFERWRKWLRGIDPDNGDGKRLRTNLHFANLAALRPQVYAKDPEFSITPTKAVGELELQKWQSFADTAEAVVDQLLVRDAKLKRRAKRQLTSAYACAVGWLKLCWQEKRETDPVIVNQLKDTQDNLERLQQQRDALDEDGAKDVDLQLAKLRETLAGLQSRSEVVVAKGATLDFVLPEDMLVLDRSVREIGDYERADAIAQRLWMTRDQYTERFGYETDKAKSYREQAGVMTSDGTAADKSADLLAVWEIWEQASGRIFTCCEGEEGFCRPTYSPDWTGERWYPYFLLAFNEIDGTWMPLSDVELTIDLVKEYNQNRDDLVRDRKSALPLNVVRDGGSLTPEDVKNLVNRQGSDMVVVKGTPGKPLSEDIFSGSLATLNPQNYDTSPARQDIEMISGGGDAARGSVLKAKTATEAEILAQGLRGRSAERTDIIEDMLSEMGKYALEMALRKLSTAEVQRIAGPDAVWPQMMPADQVFQMVSLQVRGGSTGKPDRLQEQDRWTKLLPVIEKAMAQVGELRQAGQNDAAQAVISLVRETLRRFDERIDIDRFMPEPKDGEQTGQAPQIPPEVQQQVDELKKQLEDCQSQLNDKNAEVLAGIEKARVNAARDVQIAEVTAPIEAQTKITVAQINADALTQQTTHAATLDAQLQAQAADHQAGVDATAAGQEDTKNAELAALRDEMTAIGQSQQEITAQLALVAEAAAAPKPRTPIAIDHQRDPTTGRLLRSVPVFDEEQGNGEPGTGPAVPAAGAAASAAGNPAGND